MGRVAAADADEPVPAHAAGRVYDAAGPARPGRVAGGDLDEDAPRALQLVEQLAADLAPGHVQDAAVQARLLGFCSGVSDRAKELALCAVLDTAIRNNPPGFGLSPERASTVRRYDEAVALLPAMRQGGHHWAQEDVRDALQDAELFPSLTESDAAVETIVRALADPAHEDDESAMAAITSPDAGRQAAMRAAAARVLSAELQEDGPAV